MAEAAGVPGNPKAPLALAMLGPLGLVAGGLISTMVGGRRREKYAAQQQTELEGVLGGEQLSESPLPKLMDAAYRLEQKGIAIPRTMADQIEFLQGEQVATTQENREVTRQQTGFGQDIQLADERVQAEQAAAIQKQQFEMQLAAQKMQNDMALKQFESNLEATGGGVEYGPVGTGSVRVTNADGTKSDHLIPGSVAYQSALEPVQTTAGAIDVLTTLIDEIETTGGDMFGAGSKKQGILYQQAVSVIGELANAGVLQSGEAERFMDALPDPTSMRAQGTSSASLKAPYEQLLNQLTKRQVWNLSRMQGTPVTEEMLVPGSGVKTPPPPPPGTVPYE